MQGGLRRALHAIGVKPGNTDSVPWERMRYAEVVALRAALVAEYGPACVNQSLSAVRGVMREAFRLGYITGDEWARIEDVRGVRAERLPAGRDVTEGELVKLFAACDRSDPVGVRDAALLAVLRVTGMRRAEVCRAKLENLDMEAGQLVIVGKRNKQRICHLGEAKTDVEAWLEVRGPEPGALFLSWSQRAQEFRLAGITESGVYDVLHRLAARAGVDAASPHDFRRTVAGDLLDEGVDLVTVQKMLGHDDPKTTSRYDRRGERTRRDAASKLKIPR